MTPDVQTGASFVTSSGGLLIVLKAAVQRRLGHDICGAVLVMKPLSLELQAKDPFMVPETRRHALKTYSPGVRVVDLPILNTRPYIDSCKC